MIVEPGKTYIGKVRATSKERDTLALQIRLGSTLSATNLHPPGLPASAILCIRKFRDPLPGSLHLQRTGMRPPHAWEQAVLASLKQLVDHAAHPTRDAVSSNAEAVIFADRAEMLACLASDWCEGNTLAHWWWQSLFKGKNIGELLVPTWLDTPEYIPAALHHLATHGKAIPFIQALPGNDIHTILQSVIHSFGLHELHSALETLSKAPPPAERPPSPTQYAQSATFRPTPPRQSEPSETLANAQLAYLPRSSRSTSTTEQGRPVHHTHLIQPSPPPVAPWQSWAPEITSSQLRPEQQSLLGISLLLVRAPAIVRTPSFAQALLQWLSAAQHLPSGAIRGTTVKSSNFEDTQQPHTQPEIPNPLVPVGAGALVAAPGGETSYDSPLSPKIPNPLVPVGARDGQGRVGALVAAPGGETSYDGPLSLETLETHAPILAEAGPSGAETRAAAPGGNTDPQQPTIIELLETEIETQLGGLFYLINLGLYLNLYGDFTTPLQPGISLSIWDFITLLGQQLLHDQMPTDPAWPFLAQMAGRSEQDIPGKDFEPPDSWRIPPDWLESFPEEDPWQWTLNNGRLQVQHPAQFLVLDLPLDTSAPEEQLVREMQAYIRTGEYLMIDGNLYRPVGAGDGQGGVGTLGSPWVGLNDQTSPVNVNARGEWAAQGPPPFSAPPPPLLVRRHIPKTPVLENQVQRGLTVSPALARWLRWLMSYVRPRLQRALGLPGTGNLSHILCQHHAHVSVTATHLDIVFSLAELPIEIRLSGLDRDPGWVPAAGRFIAFHFE